LLNRFPSDESLGYFRIVHFADVTLFHFVARHVQFFAASSPLRRA
jgi:hypothetical protein